MECSKSKERQKIHIKIIYGCFITALHACLHRGIANKGKEVTFTAPARNTKAICTARVSAGVPQYMSCEENPEHNCKLRCHKTSRSRRTKLIHCVAFFTVSKQNLLAVAMFTQR